MIEAAAASGCGPEHLAELTAEGVVDLEAVDVDGATAQAALGLPCCLAARQDAAGQLVDLLLHGFGGEVPHLLDQVVASALAVSQLLLSAGDLVGNVLAALCARAQLGERAPHPADLAVQLLESRMALGPRGHLLAVERVD